MAINYWSNAQFAHAWGFGTTDGLEAQRVALQISLNVGPYQDPKFLECLAADIVKDS